MTITLPDEMRDELQRKAQAEGFATIDQFVLHTLQEITEENAEDLQGMPVPDELTIKDRNDLHKKILEGLKSGPAVRLTPDLWKKLQDRAESK